MTFAATRIITDDVDGLVAFYEAVTGGVVERLHPLFAQLNTSIGNLAIASSATAGLLGDGAVEPAANRSVVLDFLVGDVDAEYRRLQTVLTSFVTEPTDMPWGNRSLLFRDPDGNLVNFFAPLNG